MKMPSSKIPGHGFDHVVRSIGASCDPQVTDMSASYPKDFDVCALYAALDAQRQARGLSWQRVALEINRSSQRVPARSLSASTIASMHTKRSVEGDGVLQMLIWLRRTPESFVPGPCEIVPETASLPSIGPHQVLRFDARALYQALNSRRLARGLTWTQLALELGGFSASSLTRLAKAGGRVAFPQVMRLTRWLGAPAAHFTRISNW